VGPAEEGSWRWGQAVLLGRGLAAWMQAVGQVLAPLRPRMLAPSPVAPPLPPLPPLVRQDLLHLMSQAVWAVAQKNPCHE
jgi:hypothetical protein